MPTVPAAPALEPPALTPGVVRDVGADDDAPPDGPAAPGGGTSGASGAGADAGGVPAPAAAGPLPRLAVEVVWADITQVPGDVYAVGHYEQVAPQSAELALDRMVSGPAAGGQLVLTSLARRGILRGALGDVAFFPWAEGSAEGARGRLVAVAGLGHPGGFTALALRRVARNLAWAVSSLPDVRTVCTVLIGGGGNLSLADAVYGLMAGMADAIAPAIWRAPIERLRIVERELGKARAIHRQLLAVRDAREIGPRVRLEVDDGGVRTGAGGVVGTDYTLALTLAAAAAAARGDADRRAALERLVDTVRHPEHFRDWVGRRLAELGNAGGPGGLGDAGGATGDAAAALDAPDLAALAARLSIRIDAMERPDVTPTRLSFTRDGAAVCAAALTDATVIPERRFEVDDALLASLAGAMTSPTPERLLEVSTFFTRLVVPRDFRAVLERAPQLTVEVDRDLARLPWEMLSDRVDRSPDARPVALKGPMARQLRTGYSPPPGAERVAHWPLRALVVGDPGDPAEGAALPGARREALAVAQLLRAKGCHVQLMIGAPGPRRDGELRDLPAADRLAVLMELMSGGYDLLHFAGHGAFDPRDPRTSGWVFAGGLLTSRLLERVDVAPSLVVANACLSARTSDALARGGTPGAAGTEADLLPGLADEFFKRGVRNYVGTAWPVDDAGAVAFAQTFYDALLPAPAAGAASPARTAVGVALHAARLALHAREREFGSLWAAYQHYGDPQHTLFADEGAPADGPP